LKAVDGSVVFGRTLEWGSFDLLSRLPIIPRRYQYATHMPDGKPGLSRKGKYGVVGIDAVGKDIVVVGMNEKGLQVGLFYHPGFAEYQSYDPAKAEQSLGPTDIGQYLLTTCATLDEVRAALAQIRLVPVAEPVLGFAPPVHLYGLSFCQALFEPLCSRFLQ
jgi:choloylglycine hydrolase